jgi:hypothetical protein
MVAPDSFAQYMGRDFLPGQRVSWNQFYNRYDNIAVKVSKDILDSDEAIVAVMAHEMHELNRCARSSQSMKRCQPRNSAA